jgi:hypothetical protein
MMSLQQVDPVSGFPLGEGKLPFQFPPIIKSDAKQARWKKLPDLPSYEPQYVYEGGNPRKIAIQTTYVVGGPELEGIGSNAEGIANVVGNWKSYFYFQDVKFDDGLPIYRIEMYRFLPPGGKGSAWRGIGFNVKYSDTWITDGGTFPLITEVTVDLELVSLIKAKDETKTTYENLDPAPLQTWY